MSTEPMLDDAYRHAASLSESLNDACLDLHRGRRDSTAYDEARTIVEECITEIVRIGVGGVTVDGRKVSDEDLATLRRLSQLLRDSPLTIEINGKEYQWLEFLAHIADREAGSIHVQRFGTR